MAGGAASWALRSSSARKGAEKFVSNNPKFFSAASSFLRSPVDPTMLGATRGRGLCFINIPVGLSNSAATTNVRTIRGNVEAPILEPPKNERRVKKEERTQLRVDTPYVPPKRKLPVKSSLDRTGEIFEGITIHELAKRKGVSIGALQEITRNGGEKADSELDPLSIDTAELVAMRARMLIDGRKQKVEKDTVRKVNEDRIDVGNTSEELSERVELPIRLIIRRKREPIVLRLVFFALTSLDSPQVSVRINAVRVGITSQCDVDLSQTCGACTVEFSRCKPLSTGSLAAEHASIKICAHRIIHHLLERGMGYVVEERTHVTSKAEVFKISQHKGRNVKIAWCWVLDGSFTRSKTMRLVRSGKVVFEGSCASLIHKNKCEGTVREGYDCRVVIQDCNDFQIGDVIQCLERVSTKPKFIPSECGGPTGVLCRHENIIARVVRPSGSFVYP